MDDQAYQYGSWSAIIIVVAAYAIGRLLVFVRVLRNDNLGKIAKIVSITVGLIYAANFSAIRSFGAILDILIAVGTGAMVALVLWVFIVMGLGAAIPDDKQ